MLRIDRSSHTLSPLDRPKLADASLSERYDLQEFIATSPREFFKELGLELFLIGTELTPSKSVLDRIDLLAVDREGACVVIELKRGNHKLHLLQALSYAGMVAPWTPDDVLALLTEEEGEALLDFLEVDREEINNRQRIVLIAEEYDYALLVAAEWLSEKHGVDICCCRIALAQDPRTNAEYLVCSNVYPAPELVQQAKRRGKSPRVAGAARWESWETALAAIANDAVRSFFEQELAGDHEGYLIKRTLRYRSGGKRRWHVAARRHSAYLWQIGRFEGDIEFWRAGLSDPDEVKEVKERKCLRAMLHTPDDFAFFLEAVHHRITPSQWGDRPFEM